MITQILFEIPAAFEAAVRTGSLVQVGGLLKDAGTGQIVAHLQESGLAQSLISKAMVASSGPVGLAAEVANLGAGLYTAVEVTQMKAMMATLQTLQYATLGAALVGVGVSVAGFAYMHKRFNALEGRIDELTGTVRSGFASQREATLRTHLSQVKGLVKAAKQAPTLSRPEAEYGRIAEAMAEQAAHFEGEVEFTIKASRRIDVEAFWQLAQLLILSNGVRIDCRIRSNELRNAREISEAVAEDYQRLFDPLSPASFIAAEGEGALVARTLREITDAAVTKPYLIEHLRTRRINGADYMQALDEETKSPILLLRT